MCELSTIWNIPLAIAINGLSLSEPKLGEKMRDVTFNEIGFVGGGMMGGGTTGGPGGIPLYGDGTDTGVILSGGTLDMILVTDQYIGGNDYMDSIKDVFNNANWTNVFQGIAIVGGAVVAVSLAPAAVAAMSAAGVAALVTQLAGIGVTFLGFSGR